MVMKLISGTMIFLFLAGGCSHQHSYFGVKNRAIIVPGEFGQTKSAIEKAEKSPGAKYCPEKIARAKKLARQGVEIYWNYLGRDQEAMATLAEARKLAHEAELCQPPSLIQKTVSKIKVIILEGVFFAFDSFKFTPEARAILDEQVAILKDHPKIKVEVAGYADSMGTISYNQALSERRARAVRMYLISKGISPDRLKVVGYGESRAIASNDTEEGRAKNRRVELKVIE
ncbi:MAG: OmpA family protein [Deltaproteobacteria bacterium]|nr:OmpA family protein [Deltaproteobacteria bacterium]MBW2075606.1 OmpA family protein [Deltaproteobacteria bacterium]